MKKTDFVEKIPIPTSHLPCYAGKHSRWFEDQGNSIWTGTYCIDCASELVAQGGSVIPKNEDAYSTAQECDTCCVILPKVDKKH